LCENPICSPSPVFERKKENVSLVSSFVALDEVKEGFSERVDVPPPGPRPVCFFPTPPWSYRTLQDVGKIEDDENFVGILQRLFFTGSIDHRLVLRTLEDPVDFLLDPPSSEAE